MGDDIWFDWFKARVAEPCLKIDPPVNAHSEVRASKNLGHAGMEERVVSSQFRSSSMFPLWFDRYKTFMLSRSRGYQLSSKAVPDTKQ